METFIHQEYISNIDICDNIIEAFNKSDKKTVGVVGISGDIDPKIKDSLDVQINHLDYNLISEYRKQLQVVIDNYVKRFPNCSVDELLVVDGQVQYYPPGRGFKVFHSERGTVGASLKRHLVFMTYLNDVTDGGETEFFHQKQKIQPRKGLTVVWPPDWTHTHRGIVSSSHDKYIITGWLRYIF